MSKAIITEQHLHDIADAIIAKGGATAAMTPAQMPAAIQAIPSGAPNQGGIPDEGWKNDGASHFWNYCANDNWTFQIKVNPVTFGDRYTISWGDGTSQEMSSQNNPVQHVYTEKGAYRVDVTCAEGVKVRFGNVSVENISGDNWTSGRFDFSKKYTHIELGENADQTGSYSQASMFVNLRGWRSRCVGGDANQMFKNCTSLTFCDIGYGWTSLSAFMNTQNQVEEFLVPSSVTNINTAFFGSRGIRSVRFAGGATITTLNSTFRNCSIFENIEIPASVTTISGYALNFINNKDVNIRFRGTIPPTFSDSNTVAVHSTAKFYVPYSADHSVLAAYKAAPNLSVYADQIYEEEES